MSSADLPAHSTISGLPASAQPLMLAQLLSQHGLIVHVAALDRDMEQLAQALHFFAPQAEILTFPAWDSMPYDRASPQPALMARRMDTLSLLASGSAAKTPRIIITTASAVLQRVPPRSVMKSANFRLRVGDHVPVDTLTHYLVQHGYRRASKAMEQGEFALRGGIVDIVPAGAQEGVRLDFFGDQLESMKPYNALTQLSEGSISELRLQPISEVMLSPERCEHFRAAYRELFGAPSKTDALYEAISAQQAIIGMEHWLPLFYEQLDTLLDYTPGALLTFDQQAEKAIEERQEAIRDYYAARTHAHEQHSRKSGFDSAPPYHPVPPDSLFLMPAGWALVSERYARCQFSSFSNESQPHSAFRPLLRFSLGQADNTPFDQLRQLQESHGKPTLIGCFSEGSRDRLHTLLSERGFHCLMLESWPQLRDVRGKTVGLAVLALENGFETPEALLVSEQDVFGERIARAKSRKKPSEAFLQEAATFAQGELVVHREHGIGRFEGLVTVTVQGAAHDCLKLIYDGDDKLFLPVENIELITRYGLEEENAKLDKLGGASWQARKAKLKQRITLAAEALIKIAAERQLQQGRAVDAPTGSYEEFCARFPYVETEDQERAIADVLADLGSGRPMDRLVCGDVGFGKTEVAMRAAFVAASQREKMQVAVIVPTTLLARQHANNFSQRFAGLPIIIRQLSRMVGAKAQKDTRDGLADGSVDIVIGTHALLSKATQFKNLGLVIVDEEQHFGVAQKEKLKSLKNDVHVLTLSATPIPRTLQMALTGVRDLSLMTTPPVDRLAVRSFVLPYDPVVLREALLREQHRGGKSFLVCPRIKDMAELKTRLAELVPELKIAVAHGQMAATELDDIMNAFYDGKYDALLSTAIIESGIDIPTANTMIIFNAHLFGLSQLYQLRGRVGRGKTRAYAYFVLPHHRLLSDQAVRRLEVMQTLDTLGAGFTLASHDMDIRGFGNLVGEEQSGHIREVGIELYQQMLEEAVASLKAASRQSPVVSKEAGDRRLENEDFSPSINLGLSVLIPESYVADLSLRLGLYRRVADMREEAEINSFAAELVDRFGPMPEETAHLVEVLGVKLLCRKAGVSRIDSGPKGAVIAFHQDRFGAPEKLLDFVEKRPRTLKIRPDMKLVFSHEWKGADDTIATLKRLLGEIAALLPTV